MQDRTMPFEHPGVGYFRQAVGKITPGRIAAAYEDLFAWQIEQQQAARASGEKPVICPIPLPWVALAEAVGLVVDLHTGAIVAGPEASGI